MPHTISLPGFIILSGMMLSKLSWLAPYGLVPAHGLLLPAHGLVPVAIEPPRIMPTSHTSRAHLFMSNKRRPKRRYTQPAPKLPPTADHLSPGYLPATSHSKVKSNWRHTSAGAEMSASVPTLQTENLPPATEGQRIPNGRYPALVLNADYTPLSYVPLSLWSWQDTVRAVIRDAVYVLSEYDVSVRSPTTTMPLPSVIVLKNYAHRVGKGSPCFTRRNLFLRDKFCCQVRAPSSCARLSRASRAPLAPSWKPQP